MCTTYLRGTQLDDMFCTRARAWQGGRAPIASPSDTTKLTQVADRVTKTSLGEVFIPR